MKDVLIVDGYNMIGAWPELNSLKDQYFEEARDRLIELLADYRGYSDMHVIIVFDAYKVPGLGAEYKQNQLEIIYTKEKETADECIERLVGELWHRRRSIYVATSDYTEQHVAFAQGGLRISARELLNEVHSARREISKKLKEPNGKPRNTFDAGLSHELRSVLEKWRRGSK